MSSSYVRDMAKSWTAGLVTPYIDVENREEDPNLPWLSLEFNSEYVEYQGMTPCPISETGVIDLVFLFKPGIGDHAIKIAEADANSFFHNADPDKRLLLTGIQTLETFNEPRWYRVVVGVEYRFTHGVLPNPNFVPKVLIKYDMETMDTLQSKARVMRNLDDVGVHSGTFAGCNVIKPSLGTDVSISYPNIHTLGSEELTLLSFLAIGGDGSGNTTLTSITNGVNIVNIGKTSSKNRPYITLINTLTATSGAGIVITFTADIISGSPRIQEVRAGSTVLAEQDIVQGENTIFINLTSDISSSDIHVYLEAYNAHTYEVDMTNFSIKEVTTPSTAYNAYYDIATQKFVQNDNLTLPVSTTYNMTADHQMFFTHNQALTTADLAALDANPNLLFDVFFNGAVLPSGFAKANIVNFPAGIEGVVGGSKVQDLALPLPVEGNSIRCLKANASMCQVTSQPDSSDWNLTDGFVAKVKLKTDIIGLGCVFGRTRAAEDITRWNLDRRGVNSYRFQYSVDATTLFFDDFSTPDGDEITITKVGGKMYYNGVVNASDRTSIDQTGNTSFRAIGYYPDAANNAPYASLTGDFQFEYVEVNGSMFDFTSYTGNTVKSSNGNTVTLNGAEWDVDPTAYEINNYEAAVRDDNGTNGATNLLVEQDGSGRAIATTPDKTVNAYPITPDAPFTIPSDYTIDEVVQLDNSDYHHYIYTSEGKLYTDGALTGSFTKPSGDWVLDDKTFDKAHTIKLRGGAIFRNYAFTKVSQVRSAYLEAKILYPLIP